MNRKILYAVGDRLLRYVYKNPRRNLVKLVKVGKLVAGKMFPPSTFTKPIEIIEDEDNVWHQFLFRGLDEVDPALFRRIALTFAIDLGYFGTKALRANREKEHCNIPWVVLMDPTSACNRHCKGCWAAEYGHKSNLTLDEMRRIVRECKALGTHFFMYTGGEPLIRKDFRYLLTELKKMGLLVSVNSNGSLIDRDWLDFFRHEPPFRFNITLYGASDAAYERLCGRPMFARVTENIRALRELGVEVKLNVSMTPYNVADMAEIYRIAQELGTPMQLATYMFPPIRRDEALVGSNDRFTACQAAEYSVQWDRLRLTPEQFRQRAQAMKQGLALPSEDDVCDGTPGEGVACRAGRSAFWINWQGGMTPCGMMTQPLFSVPELGFAQAWERTRAATERIRLPGACAGCRLKEICHACAAMCVTETGHFDTKPEYVCEMTHETVRRTIEEAENGNS